MEALAQEHTLGPVRHLEVCLVKDAASLLQMVGQARSHIPDVVRQGLLRLLAQAGSQTTMKVSLEYYCQDCRF